MLSLIDYIHQCNYTIYLFKRLGRVFFFLLAAQRFPKARITTKSANKCTGALKTGTNILQASCCKTGHHFDSDVPRKKVYLRLSILFLFNYQIYIHLSVTHQRPTLIVDTNQSSNQVHWWHGSCIPVTWCLTIPTSRLQVNAAGKYRYCLHLDCLSFS